VVDGAAVATTALTLSHWPNNTTPERYRRETSTETALAWVAEHDPQRVAAVVSNNHFDEDGLLSMYAVVNPRDALARAALLGDAARAGDFGVWRTRAAARLCFTIEAHVDPALSPLPRRTLSTSGAARVAALYRSLLGRLPRLIDEQKRLRPLWQAQDAQLDAGEEWLAARRLVIEEEPALDLAIVRLPDDAEPRTAWRYLRPERAVVHPFVIHNATRCARLVRLQGRRIEFQYRYESWLALPSRRPAPRVDLAPFCRWLNRQERHGRWIWENPLDLAPRLYREHDEPSTLTPAAFLHALRQALRTLPSVWDAYNWPPPRRPA
jgi:hypothetical protein